MTWIHDLVLSYVGGIALGTPIGLLALLLTSRTEILTGIIVGMMCCVLLVRRCRAGVTCLCRSMTKGRPASP
jgi:hypothetical protein